MNCTINNPKLAINKFVEHKYKYKIVEVLIVLVKLVPHQSDLYKHRSHQVDGQGKKWADKAKER